MLVMCEEVGWEELVEVMECLKRGKAVCPDEIMYVGGLLVVVMLLTMNVVMMCESVR